MTVKGVPPPCLFPNRRRSLGSAWREIHEATAAQREQAAWEAKLSAGPAAPLTGPVVLWLSVHWPTARIRRRGNRMPDASGVIGACKGLEDGLVDGGWIEDDRLVTGYMVSQHETEDPVGWIDVRLTEAP